MGVGCWRSGSGRYTGRAAAGNAGFIVGYRSYLTEVRDRTAAERRAGKTADEAVEAVAAALGSRCPDRARLAGAIKAAYAEAR